MSSQRVHTLILGNCEYVTLYDKRTLQMGFRLKTLRWGDYLGLFKWDQSNHTLLYKKSTLGCGQRGMPSQNKGQRDVIWQGLSPLLLVLKMKEGGHKPRDGMTPNAENDLQMMARREHWSYICREPEWSRNRESFPLSLGKGMQPYWHLNFSLVRSMWDTRPAEL